LKNAPRNATYVSRQIQNQLIDCLAHIKEKIVLNATKADLYHHQRSVEVAEHFLRFIQLEKVNAEGITDSPLIKLGELKVELGKLKG